MFISALPDGEIIDLLFTLKSPPSSGVVSSNISVIPDWVRLDAVANDKLPLPSVFNISLLLPSTGSWKVTLDPNDAGAFKAIKLLPFADSSLNRTCLPFLTVKCSSRLTPPVNVSPFIDAYLVSGVLAKYLFHFHVSVPLVSVSYTHLTLPTICSV